MLWRELRACWAWRELRPVTAKCALPLPMSWKRYGTGKRRIPLENVGISPLNRIISGKHVHTLGRRILSVEGFCLFRYRCGLCHEWDPQNPLEVATFTNRAARRDPLLAPVPEVPLFGSFAKSHLLSFLQASVEVQDCSLERFWRPHGAGRGAGGPDGPPAPRHVL